MAERPREPEERPVVIGLSAVVVAVRDGEAMVLTVRPRDRRGVVSEQCGVPFGPFDPDSHRTFELALRAFVTQQTRFELGYVEQLYTFGDRGRDAPVADMGPGAAPARVISVGYLGLTPKVVDTHAPDTAWASWARGPLANTATRTFLPVPEGSETTPRTFWSAWRVSTPSEIESSIVSSNFAVARDFTIFTASETP